MVFFGVTVSVSVKQSYSVIICLVSGQWDLLNNKRFVARTYPPCWVLKPLLFHDKCPGFFYVHYTTHRTYSFTSHLKDET